MTHAELITAQDAYAKLTSLQQYLATLQDSTAIDVPPAVLVYSPTLPGDFQASLISIAEGAVSDAQSAFDNL